MKKIIFALCLVIVTTTGVKSQDSTSAVKYRKSWWVDFGAGWGGQQLAGNFSMHGEISKGNVLSYSYDNTRYNGCWEDTDGKISDSYSLLFGKLHKGKSGVVRFSIGLSLTKIRQFDYTLTGSRPTVLDAIISFFGGSGTMGTVPVYDQKITEQSTWGIPMDLHLMLSSKRGGIGINPHINFNPVFTYASLTITASLGRIRKSE